GKIFFKKDLREFESKNAGATNSMRVYGKKVALVVLLLDISKCMLPTFIMWVVAKFGLDDFLYITESFNPYNLVYITSFFSIIGHCWPIFYKFKGGKGASCLGAFTLCISPFVGIIAFLIWIIVMKITKYVSFASIVASWMAAILIFIPGINWMYLSEIPITDVYLIGGYGIYHILFVSSIIVLAAIALTWKHKENIKRLLKGEERKIKGKSSPQ
ncbi:MAG: glycerol-3-phosphate 1-O-acyltransferase PlsY, partial [Mycoplasma sp.]